MDLLSRPGGRAAAGLLASAVLSFFYARGGAGWVLGFVALVPWLRTLDATHTLGRCLLNAWAMSVAFTLAAFPWFGAAIGHYAQLGTAVGLLVLLVAAPLFQPQILVFALVRHRLRRRGLVLGALAGAAAWVATEWLVPRMLGDSYGYGLYPSRLLRQAADVGGTAGLTLLLLLVNEAVAAALARRGQGLRAVARPVGLALLVPLLLAAYGWAALAGLPAAPDAKPLRVGLVQSNIADYERLRQEKGVDAVVREVLDTHYEMSHGAVAQHRADAVLWSETVYPTTFGNPKSEGGAELDREIQGFINAAGVPFVFGTYDRDEAGEYNAAAFVNPGTGLVGFYRKTRLFPLTEYVPAWLDSAWLRQLLPWTGAWRAGNGARVFPLRLADGREIPVLPLICRDDVDTGLGIDGARLGAQAIFTMSNDAWFTRYPQGAELHQAAAAFRSIETRLPQFRVTTTGYSAAIDATGTVVASTQMGQRTLVIGDLPVTEPPRTLIVMWGDWVGPLGAAFLAALAVIAGVRRWRGRRLAEAAGGVTGVAALPADVAVLPPAVRVAAGLLRGVARLSLLAMALVFLFGDGPFRTNNFAQIRAFSVFFLAPELAAWLLLRAFAAQLSLEAGLLVFTRGRRRLELPLADVAAVEPWRWPIPGSGAWLRLGSGARWPSGLLHADPAGLARAIEAAGGAAVQERASLRARTYAQVRRAIQRGWLEHSLVKYGLFPLLLAVPAFRVHQFIVFGSSFGELQVYGLAAYLKAFALWWAAWTIAVVVCAAVLRAFTELGTLASVWLRPGRALDARWWLDRGGLAVLYLGLPGWLLLKTVGS
ncbi:apolipoprotein N-acyltransferase [Rhizobacter sp. J219]|uniref:apolipoprotein N-acyltransferase n=1 Tax=Rhizobacter sp. J219 TaxID=2898430 RepID=UPI002151C644|nr:apolipoprotein N-acyltransferase [Rhizobacter sp. J219]MCR5882897.1 apolipoprotein N-acyltransferase [Rhizobacter sp. J219]